MKQRSLACSAAAAVMLHVSAACAQTAENAATTGYPAEEIYDTSVHPDEALVNVNVTFDRWPDCSTLKSTMDDIFRLENVRDKPDQDKAMALWKWFRVLVSATGGTAWEGAAGQAKLVQEPHKILTVYGHNECDGLSWVMAPLWRAAGYMAFDECTHGHTTAALRYRDADGQMRFHSFDPQHHFYYWDEARQIVGTRSMPVMYGMVYRHLTAPQHLHSLRTSLRLGETIDRRWDNEGYVTVPPDKDKGDSWYYAYEPGKTRGIYAAAGEEIQVLELSSDPACFAAQLYEGSRNTACSKPATGLAALHPTKAGELATFIYRLAPPYMVIEATCEARLVKTAATDLCRLSVSLDGATWSPVFVKDQIGEETITINLGRAARAAGKPDVYTAYDFFIKAEFQTTGDVRGVGFDALKLTVWRQLNKRTLPNLRPGENYVRVTADKLAKGQALELEIAYALKGEAHQIRRFITEFPYYFRIDAPDAVATKPKEWDYDQKFNDGDIRMSGIKMRLVPASRAPAGEASLKEADVLPKFAAASPHPADYSGMEFKNICWGGHVETDIRQTSGFLPQGDFHPRDDDAVMRALLKHLHGDLENDWIAVEALGHYPKALDALLGFLPEANGDQLLFICKALALQKSPKAVKPLLEKWKQGGGAPGARYIPDVLAAIGDPGVVHELVAPLKEQRFDFRFHVAHALGILGGDEAGQTLADLAAHDPLRAVREEAAASLKKLHDKK